MFKRLFGQKPSKAQSGDEMVISELVKAGADLRQPRDTVHYLYFQSEEGANVAAEKLRAHGLTANAKPAASGNDPWVVIAKHDYIVNLDSIRDIRRVAEEAAQAGSGDYDGWEAAAEP
jgi:hypothetical protein